MRFIAIAVLLAACGGGGGPFDAAGPLSVQAQIGPAGGTITVDDSQSPYFGTSIVIPPGALAAPVEITIRRVTDRTLPPHFLVAEFGPTDLRFLLPVEVRVRYSRDLLRDFAITNLASLVVVALDGAELLETLRVADDLVHARTTRLGRFVVESLTTGLTFLGAGDLHRGFFQPRVLDTELRLQNGVGVTFGGTSTTVGKGSRAGFLAGGGDNLLLLHGLLGDGQGFSGPTDLVAALGPHFDNVLVYQYPSGRGVAENANWLFNEITAHADPARFRTVVHGHSMGGIVARYLLEKSAADPARRALDNYDPGAPQSLDGMVTHLFTTGSPHRGAGIVDLGAWLLQGAPDVVDLALSIQGLRDLQDGSAGIPAALNAGFVRPPGTAYHLLAGRLCAFNGTVCLNHDGLVSVASATGNPELSPQVFSHVFDAGHSDLHNEALLNGVADHILAALGR